jgi:hypothetical protein
MNYKALSLVSFSLCFLAWNNVALALGMSTSWKHTTASQRACLERAQQAMRDADFSENLQIVEETVFGDSGEYTASSRCISEKELVFFVVSGPDSAKASHRVDNIYNNY